MFFMPIISALLLFILGYSIIIKFILVLEKYIQFIAVGTLMLRN